MRSHDQCKKIYGVGAVTGGRRFVFVLRGGRFAFPEFEFAGDGVDERFALAFARLALPLAFRFWLRFEFAFALAFALAGFRFGVGLGLGETLLLLFCGLISVSEFEFTGVLASPLAGGRLISTATVWPTFTISPACGS